MSHWETGKAGRERRRRSPLQDDAGRTRQPGDLPSQASPQPPNGEYSAERTPVSATREASVCARVGVRPPIGHTHRFCTHRARPQIAIVARQTCFLVTNQSRHEEYGDERRQARDT